MGSPAPVSIGDVRVEYVRSRRVVQFHRPSSGLAEISLDELLRRLEIPADHVASPGKGRFRRWLRALSGAGYGMLGAPIGPDPAVVAAALAWDPPPEGDRIELGSTEE